MDMPKRDSEERFRLLVQNSNDAIALLGEDGVVSYVSDQIEKITGYRPQELIGRNPFELIHPEDRPHVMEVFSAAVDIPKAERTAQYRHRTADGGWVHLEAVGCNLLHEPLVKAVVLNVRDISERKRAEDALRISEQRFRDVYENLRDGMAAVDERGHIVQCNGQFLRMLGYTFDQLSALTYEDITPGRWHELELRILQEQVDVRGYSDLYEKEYIRQDGTTFPVELQTYLVRDPSGNKAGYWAFARDITQRKRAEEALHESEETFRALSENSLDVIMRFDRQGRHLYVNNTVEGQTGIPASQFIGRTHAELGLPEALCALWDKEIQATFSGKASRRLEFQLPSGVWIDWLVMPEFDAQCEVKAVLTSARDITDRKKAEQELREKSAELERYFTTALDLFCIADTEGCFRRLNRQWEKTLGYKLEDLEGKRFLDFVHPDDQGSTQEAAARLEGQREVLDFVNRYRCSDGTYRWIEWRSYPSGKSIFAAARDITDKRRAEEEKERLVAQLQQATKMEAIGRLAGGVAHDFNNLLTGISGYTELLLANLSQEDPMRADLMEVKKAADRAASLTTQLLAFSRKQIIAPRVIDLNGLLADSTKMVQRLIGEDIELLFVPGASLGLVNIDPHQMEQVLVNLAINARDAMPDGGKLTIETANTEIDEDYCRMHLESRPGPHVLLVVSDSGCGMSPEIMEHLFEPFFTTKDTGKGTGLGLSMIYGIVQQGGGHIHVSSEVGTGTVFKIYFPRVVGEAAAVRKSKRDALPRGTETILLVEDDAMVRGLAQRFLQRQGYTVIQVESSGKAWGLAEDPSLVFDLLLTDVIMPQLNGRQLFERMRATRPGLRVLFMSGYTKDVIAHHGVLEEGTQFLQKPFSSERLARKVREALDAPCR